MGVEPISSASEANTPPAKANVPTTGIEPVSLASEAKTLSVKLRRHGGQVYPVKLQGLLSF